MNGYLLDTHVWIWAQQRQEEELSAELFTEIEGWQKKGHAFVSAMSLWETARLVADGQVDLGTSVEEFLRVAVAEGGLQYLELTPGIMIESTRLPGEIHRDPADRILAATARDRGLTLVTRDKLLLSYAKQGFINARRI